MRKPKHDMSIFKERRTRLAEKISGGALITPAAPEYIRNNDVHHAYRQDSNLFYLTGFEEPESVLVFRPGKDPETVMFVRNKDVLRETWEGFRYGADGTQQEFGIDKAYLIEDFEKEAPGLLDPIDKIYYTLFHDIEFDEKIGRVLLAIKDMRRRSGKGLLPISDALPIIGEMRLIKSEHEADVLRKACRITAEAHLGLMKYVRPGMNERRIQGRFVYEIMKRGAAREGYGTIVAGGASATTLHYVFNDQNLRAEDLVLIDAGGEYDFYTGDITRTFPVGGKFSAPQKRIYQKVLDLQKQIIDMVKPGLQFSYLQDRTIDGLVDIMIDEGLVSGKKTEIIEKGDYRAYYPHGVSHWLGMDVHDAGMVEVNGEPRVLEPGMAFTVEPGLYIPVDDPKAPTELRGIGIRIEDNILVTPEGRENMTAGAPKEVDELESLIGTGAIEA
ncbi:MAG: aminopeptidase P N-terminal domain-containing protein [Bdellovibrionaceae bacterium]|nr:aminopeptidase P N-terminal domain-containing protein [Bdellovibrionales bacterium]MCB9086199.1 aminopeptidase P N-terminal domain-containing protein [Pseudobdellovibrionaceae bacterium]